MDKPSPRITGEQPPGPPSHRDQVHLAPQAHQGPTTSTTSMTPGADHQATSTLKTKTRSGSAALWTTTMYGLGNHAARGPSDDSTADAHAGAEHDSLDSGRLLPN